MAAGIKVKEIMDRLAREDLPKRRKVSLYLDDGLYKLFREVCEEKEVPAYRVIEELMREVIAAEGRKK